MKLVQRLLLGSAGLLATGAVLMPVAMAADADTIETVVVSGVRESLRDSMLAKKNADVITENISTKDIGQLPDVTIAEELNRLPGLNTVLDRGNASQAAVRGLGPRLVLGLINGREVASSEPDQNVRWEIYPSEVISGVQVYKSQTADIVSGGIAASIDIKTIDPLDYSGPKLTMRAGPTYNDEANALPNFNPWGFRGSASYVTHLTDTLAVAVAASFQREKNGIERFQGWGYNLPENGYAGDVTGDGVEDATPWGAQVEVKKLTQDRFAVSGVVQWRPTDNLEVKLDLLHSAYTMNEDQYQQWYGNDNKMGDYTTPSTKSSFYTTNGTNDCDGTYAYSAYACTWGGTGSNLTTENGVIVGGKYASTWMSVSDVIGKYIERHSLNVGGLNVKWSSGDWQVITDLSHSEAYRHNLWMGILTESWPTSTEYYTGKSGTPWYHVYSDAAMTTVSNPSDVSSQYAYNWQPTQNSGPESTRDHISAAAITATRAVSGSILTEIDFGGRIVSRGKNHANHFTYVCPDDTLETKFTYVATNNYSCGSWSSYNLDSTLLSNFTMRAFDVPTMLYGDFDQIAEKTYPDQYANHRFKRAAGDELLGEHWTVNQDIYEGFVKAGFGTDIAGMALNGSFGVRIVSVHNKSLGYEQAGTDETSVITAYEFTPVSYTKSYTDVLPSLNVNLHLTDDQVLRFGASMAQSRAPLDELRAGSSLAMRAPWTGSRGNPELNPYRASQVDLGYEYYFHEESMFAAAVFYKHLNSFIGYETINQTIGGTAYQIAHPINGNGGNLTGLETSFQTRFYFVPVAFLQDFGVYANYAYVNSSVKEFTPVSNPMESSGLAKHTSEIDLWYSAHGLETRVSYKIHSPFTVIAGWNSQTLTRVDWERTMDGSISYNFGYGVGVRFQARNLTNAHSRSYYDNNTSETAYYDVYGRSFLFDISYKN
jgi:iron complex outermembrane recepter protein